MAMIHHQILPQGTPLGVYEIKEATKIDATYINYRAWNHHLKESILIQEYFPSDYANRAANGHDVDFKSASGKDTFACGLTAFLAQADILAEIEHPNIHAVENILQFNGTAYLIRPNLEGATLAKLVETPGSIAETELKFILLSMLDALKTVHQQGLLHGDIQPGSILLNKQGDPVLTDFARPKLAIAAHTGRFVDFLAPGYAAPELYELNEAPGPASDLYALGATMYYCLTGNQPTPAQNRISALSNGEADPIGALAKTLENQFSADLLQAVDWMLQPAQAHRPQSVNEIIPLLNAEAAESLTNEATGKQEANREPESRPFVKQPVLAGALVALAGLIIFGFWMFNKPAQITSDKSETVTAPPLSQANRQETAGSPAIPKDPPTGQSTGQITHEANLTLSSSSMQNASNKPEKAIQPAITETHQETSADNKPGNNHKDGGQSAAIPKSPPETNMQSGNIVPPQTPSDITQKTPVTAQSPYLTKKLMPAKKAPKPGTVAGYLAAARNAMKDLRFTTPPGNNAYEYYQKVLAKDPDNPEALAGRQRIVKRYVKFIRLSKAEGEVERAKRVLKKAESVSPNDPQLLKIREELYDDR